MLVDQHAAHERLVYERLKAERAKSGVARQALLSPLVVDLDSDDAARLVEAADLLASLGLVLEPFGPGAVAVHEAPAALRAADIEPLVRDLAVFAGRGRRGGAAGEKARPCPGDHGLPSFGARRGAASRPRK